MATETWNHKMRSADSRQAFAARVGVIAAIQSVPLSVFSLSWERERVVNS